MAEGLEALSGAPVLVTGATGFLGTHLCRALVAAGAEVHALRRRPEAGTRLPCAGLVWHTGDLSDLPLLRRVAREVGPRAVFHLAAYGTTFEQDDAALAYATNVEGSWNLWRALSGVPCRIVYAGSCGEYGQAKAPVREDHVCRPEWFYPATKHAATVLLSTLGMEEARRDGSAGRREVVTLRPFGPYGPADDTGRIVPHAVRTLLSGDEVKVTLGEQLRDFAFVDDHVAAFLLAATRPLPRPGAVFNVGSGRVDTLRSILEAVARAVGGDAPARLRFGAVPYRASEVWEMCGDVTAARRDLGFEARVPLEEGLARTVAWHREERALAAQRMEGG